MHNIFAFAPLCLKQVSKISQLNIKQFGIVLPMYALTSPGPVDRKPRQVDGKQGRLKVRCKERFLEMQVIEDVLGELGRGHPDDVNDQEDKDSHG